LVDTRAYRPARNIFGCLRDWQKTLVDFAFWEARLGATRKDLHCPAEHDPFRPGRFIIIYQGSALAQDRPSVAW
jgi:hypothetical protein